MKINIKKIHFEKPGRARTILILLFIALAVGLVADIVFRVVSARVTSVPPLQTAATEATDTPDEREPLETYSIIWERNLLQTTDQVTAVEGQMDLTSLQATRLQIELLGTVAGDGEYNYAIIEDKEKKKQRLLKVGDTIGNATLARVMRNAVVLRVGDRDEVLKMKRPEERAPSRAERVPGRLPPATEARDIGTPPPDTGPQADVLNILTQARLSPHISMGSSGKPDGVAVSNIREGSVLQNIGLVNGDVIQEVNGKAISNPSDIVDAYKDLKPGSTISVKIRRMGKQVTLNYNMD
jgi:general secretion pathway protein C